VTLAVEASGATTAYDGRCCLEKKMLKMQIGLKNLLKTNYFLGSIGAKQGVNLTKLPRFRAKSGQIDAFQTILKGDAQDEGQRERRQAAPLFRHRRDQKLTCGGYAKISSPAFRGSLIGANPDILSSLEVKPSPPQNPNLREIK